MPHVTPSPQPIATRVLIAEPSVAPLMRVAGGSAGLDRPISHTRIQKSGLALAGHLVGVVATRVQILGETEISYLESLTSAERVARARGFFALGLSAVIVTRGVEPLTELVAVADELGVPLLVAEPRSSRVIGTVHSALDRLLAPRDEVHGVMIDVHGIGVLLSGPSGIGKSEAALVLIERGHRLVADDRVALARLPQRGVVGSAPPLLAYHLEIRGLGILNVRDLFGATAVRDECSLDLWVELCRQQDVDAELDRLGIEDVTRDVLGAPVPIVRIPVYPGRDMGVLVEVAARNQLLKRAGHHSARAFAARLAAGLGLPKP